MASYYGVNLICTLISTMHMIWSVVQVAQVCTNCGVKMGEYFCEICKFFDDDVSDKHALYLFCGVVNKIL